MTLFIWLLNPKCQPVALFRHYHVPQTFHTNHNSFLHSHSTAIYTPTQRILLPPKTQRIIYIVSSEPGAMADSKLRGYLPEKRMKKKKKRSRSKSERVMPPVRGRIKRRIFYGILRKVTLTLHKTFNFFA